ncbi:MAG: radical SAM protein [Candidatus Thermoplasmatota archaeon]|nr:radical SAM protein [Candidatus Thermoplasmatota archaeon]
MKVIYGPVASWRLGRSLGIDLICSPKKICSFDCIYCQLQHTARITAQRQAFVDSTEVKTQLQQALSKTTPDVITLSGMGEPTLATTLDETIKTIREMTAIPIAILTNSSFMDKKEVRDALRQIDIIVAKLDAPNEEVFNTINRPAPEISFDQVVRGIKTMNHEFKGKFALQMMFMPENKACASQMATLAREIKPDEVQINTPLRPCNVSPLPEKEVDAIEQEFSGLQTISVYHSPKPKTDPLDKVELLKRRRLEL